MSLKNYDLTTRKAVPRLFASVLIALTLIAAAGLFHTSRGIAETPKLIVSVIDVGQGDSILTEFPNGQSMLVDAGGRSSGSTVVNYLRQRKISKIDILVASHPHEDHIGGMLAVLDAFQVGKVWDSGYAHGSKTQENYLGTVKAKGIRFGMPKAGFTQDVGEARIEVLAPVRALSGTNSDANNNSIVIRIVYGQTSFLLTGDMETEERNTVSSWPKTTVLKVAHHGSRNGTDRYFLSALFPQIAVISYGAGNSYGHPHAEAVSALQSANVKTYSTAEGGTVQLSTDGETVSVKTLGQSQKSGAGSSTKKQPSPQAGPEAGSGKYIGNVNSKIFHRHNCSSLPAEKNRVYFNTREEAINKGYRPCKRCNP